MADTLIQYQELEEASSKMLMVVWREVERARALHAPMHSDHEAYGVIKEEFDELWEEMKKNPKKMSEVERKAWHDRKRTEAIQMAAMCLRYITDVLDR